MHEAGFDPKECRPADPALRALDQELDGVDGEVIYPVAHNLHRALSDTKIEAICYTAYNDFIAEFCRSNPQRFVGLGVVVNKDPSLAAAEIRRVGAEGLGLKGVSMSTSDAAHPIWHADWEQVWKAAAESKRDHPFPCGWRHYDS